MITEQEYMNSIQKIRAGITRGETADTEKKLEDMYHYKPVRLLWYIAKAEWYLACGERDKVWPLLSDKFNAFSYPGMEELADFHLKWALAVDGEDMHRRLSNFYSVVLHSRPTDQSELEQTIQAYMQTEDTPEARWTLARQFLTDNEVLIFYILYLEAVRNGLYPIDDRRAWYHSVPNYGYLEEKLNNPKETFILLTDTGDEKKCDILASVISRFGNSVYIVSEPQTLKADRLPDAATALGISLANRQGFQDATVIPPVKFVVNGRESDDNSAEIVNYITRCESKRDLAILICSNRRMRELNEGGGLRGRLGILADCYDDAYPHHLSFAWVGNPTAYLSDIYCMDVEGELNSAEVYDFSFVLPARNSAATLAYTIQTCLHQDFTGSYEIVVSDNSTEENDDVLHLIESIDDERVKYYRTPRNLELSKSFEFAVLKSRGSCIIPLGSDDGACSYALSVLARTWERFPEEPLIQWDRGFYAWPGFNGGSQEHQLVVPGHGKLPSDGSYFLENTDYFISVLGETSNIFLLPNLYINSAFQRKYLKTLLDKTGRLWDGCNQDVYMGIVNLSVNPRILNIRRALTVAGMSEISLGYRAANPLFKKVINRNYSKEVKANENVGRYTAFGIEKWIPDGDSDSCLLYRNLLRVIQNGILPRDWLGEFLDFKQIYSKIFSELSNSDPCYDRDLHQAQRAAKQFGKDFEEWFDKSVYQPCIAPVYQRVVERGDDTKTYKEGRTEQGTVIVNASSYGVSNIEQAVKLFEKIYQAI